MAAVVGVDPTAADLGSMNYIYYITLVSITILVYDFILTFAAEVERFWFAGRVNLAICLFYLNRYLVIFGYVPILIEGFWVTNNPAKMQMSVPDDLLSICRNLRTYHEVFSTVVQAIVAVILTMRIYALYKCNVRVLMVFVGISVILFGAGCWASFSGYTSGFNQDVLVPVGCGVSTSHDRAIRFAASWGAMFIFDLIVFGMTLYKILTIPRSNNANALTTVFMRDGAMYFGIMAVSVLINILSLLLGPPLSRDVGMTCTNILSSVMISRLMLNLRDPSLVPVPGRNTSEDMSYPNLTFVESDYPTEVSGSRFVESESSRGRHRIGDLHRPAGSDIELHRIGV